MTIWIARDRSQRRRTPTIRRAGRVLWLLHCVGLCGICGCATRRDINNVDELPATTSGTTTAESTWTAQVRSTMTDPWTVGAVLLYRRDGSTVPLKSRKATYVLRFPGSTRPLGDALAESKVFHDPTTGRAFAGQDTEYYVETADGIAGFRYAFGVLQWFDSAITKAASKDTVDDLVHRYQGDKLYYKLHEGSTQDTDLRPFVPWEFFTDPPGSSTSGRIFMVDMKLKGEELMLRIDSPTRIYHATFYIDTKSKEVVRALNEGKEVFPKSDKKRARESLPG
jgi:hypothetical protein